MSYLASLSNTELTSLFGTMAQMGGCVPWGVGLLALSPSEKEDVREGRCLYREHDGTPILDYRNGQAQS
jgi:hypothetical protein